MRGEDASNVAAIPAQNRLTHQILQSHRAEQLCLRTKQRVEATVEESVLRTEMENFESQEEDTPKQVLWYTPMIWMGQIRPHHRDETWCTGLCQTFFDSCVGTSSTGSG